MADALLERETLNMEEIEMLMQGQELPVFAPTEEPTAAAQQFAQQKVLRNTAAALFPLSTTKAS